MAMPSFCFSGKYLRKEKTEVVYLLTRDDFNNDTIEKIKEGSPSNCHHSVLKVNDKFVDTLGICSKYQMFQKWSDFQDEIIGSISVPLDLVLESINEVTWNRAFSRRLHLQQIDDILNLDGLLMKDIQI